LNGCFVSVEGILCSADVTATLTQNVGTPLYMAPDTSLTKMVDVWAYGMIVWEVLTGVSLEAEFRGKYQSGFGLMNALTKPSGCSVSVGRLKQKMR
jgi:serine/threonine protein kinase